VTRILVILLPFLVGGFAILAYPRGLVLLVGAVAVVLSLAGAVLRRYGLVLAAAVLLSATYVGALVAAERGLDIWGAMGLGMGNYLILEAAHDWIAMPQARAGARVHARRILLLLAVLAFSAAGTHLVVTFGLNLMDRLPELSRAWVAIPAVALVVALGGSLVRFWVKK